MKRRIFSLLLALCLIVGLLPAVAIPHAHAAVTTATVTLFGTAVTVDLDETTTDIPEAYYWVNGEEGAVPVAATAEDDWNYAFAIIDDIPTVTLRNAVYKGTASFLYGKYDGKLKVVYEGTNNITVPYSSSAARYFLSFSASTNGASTNRQVYIEGAEDAVLNVDGGDNNSSMLVFSNKVYVNITGGTLNIEKTVAGGAYAVIGGAYSKTTITNCNLTVKDYTSVKSKHPTVTLGYSGTTYPVTITNSNVTIESNAYAGLCAGVYQSNGNGVLYPAAVTVDNSNVKIVNECNTDSTAAYSGVGIYATKLTVKNSTLEVEAAKKAFHGTSTATPALTYASAYNMFTAKGDEAATEYAATPYFKVAPCDHSAVEGVEEITKNPTCTEVGSKTTTYTCAYGHTWTETVEIPATGHTAGETLPDSAVGAFVTYCSVCGEKIGSEPATKLETAYTLKIDGTPYKLSHYDIPIYLINDTKTGYFNVTETKEVTNEETGEVTTETVTTLTAMEYASPSATGADADNYNAKLIWHTGDAAPTLYLKDFTLSSYNDELSQWRRNSAGSTQVIAGMHTGSTAPLKIVLEGGESVIKAYAGLQYQNELTIESVGDAKLTLWTQNVGIAPSSVGSQYVGNGLLSGNKLTLNANLTVSQGSWSNATHSPHIIRVIGADLVINGGNIVTDYRGAAKSVRGIGIENSGNLYVNGGYVYAESYNSANLTEAAIQVAGDIYIKGGTVEVKSANQSGMLASNFYISGGTVNINVNYGGLVATAETGVIEITGGTIESASDAKSYGPFKYKSAEKEQSVKLPTVTAPEGKKISIVAGDSKDVATEVKDAANYGYNNKYVKVEFVDKPACDHTNTTTTEEPITDATCTVAGSKKVTVTCECGEIISEQIIEIAAKGHTEKTTVETVDATCETAGSVKTTVICETCGETLSETTEEIAAKGHTEEIIAGKDATCTETGLTEGKKCTVCGITTVEQTVIDALGHTEVTTTETKEATCGAAGYTKTIVICSVCGDTISETVDEIPATDNHVFDDANDTTCNDCGYVRGVEPTFELDENNKLVLVDPNADHIYHRVIVYFLGDNTVKDIELTNPLKELDPNAKTYWGVDDINKVVLTNPGNYVLHLLYNTAGSPKILRAKAVTVEANASVPTLNVENGKLVVTDESGININHRATVYYLGAETVKNAYNVEALKAIDSTAKTTWTLKDINKVYFAKSGNYVVVLDYNTPGSKKLTVAKAFTVVVSKPTITRDGYNLKVTDNDATHKNHRATVYYVGSDTVADIYDEAALKALDPTAKTYWGLSKINKLEVAKPGTYVVYLSYNLASGVKQTVVVKTTTKMPVPAIWLEESGQIGTYVPTEVAHRNYVIYYLGDQTVEDIYDIDALNAIDANPLKFESQKQVRERGLLTEKGNYVLVVYYNYAGSSKQVIAEFATLR